VEDSMNATGVSMIEVEKPD